MGNVQDYIAKLTANDNEKAIQARGEKIYALLKELSASSVSGKDEYNPAL